MRAARRLSPVLCAVASLSFAQETTLKTTVPLVVAPTTIVDRAGRYVRNLTPSDLLLLDNNVPRQIQVDELTEPISLVVAVQSTQEAWAALDKIKKVGSMIEPLVAGERGQAAVIWYGHDVTLAQGFTSDTAVLEAVFQQSKARGSGGSAIDAVAKAVDLLAGKKDNRKVVFVIGESKDRGSQTPLEQVISRAQRDNITVYFITYSRFLTPFTARWEPVCDARGENCKPRDPEWGDTHLMAVFGEMRALAKTDVAEAFAKYTGGRRVSFLKQKSLEEVIESLGEEIHNQYLLSFTPPHSDAAEFHQIRVTVRHRPDLVVRSRAGYWPVR
ncbi:MAG TPA: VWA domain-containing protein [Bryobacteraceae bacterium]|nr:VWA domain-containing protein [Bryobacteraceae bacterium]